MTFRGRLRSYPRLATIFSEFAAVSLTNSKNQQTENQTYSFQQMEVSLRTRTIPVTSAKFPLNTNKGIVFFFFFGFQQMDPPHQDHPPPISPDLRSEWLGPKVVVLQPSQLLVHARDAAMEGCRLRVHASDTSRRARGERGEPWGVASFEAQKEQHPLWWG